MSNLKLKYVIDMGMLFSFLAVAITGILKLRGIMQYFGWHNRDPLMINMSLVHDASGIILVILIVIHLVLNWKWMINMTKRYF